MKSSILCCLLVTSLGLSGFAEEGEYRKWRTKLGSTYEAKFEKMAGRAVVLKTKQGLTKRVLVSSLSAEDSAYLADMSGGGKSAPASNLPPTPYLTKAERAVIEEMNLVRQDPKGYVQYLQAHRASFIDGRVYVRKGGGRIASKEGVSAVDEAIDFLKKAKPLGPLVGSKGLSLGAKDHADDLGPKGKTGHDGTDGSNTSDRVGRHGKWLRTVGENISFGPSDARVIVTQLLVDDGVPSRGHRENIFGKNYGVVGVAMGTHKVYGTMCVIDYAGGFKDK